VSRTLPGDAGFRNTETLLFAALLILHLVPIWVLPFFPTEDGPGHQAVANVLREYDEPEGRILREYYDINEASLTNWFVFAILSHGLGFLPVPVAEKVLLSGYVLLLPLSVRYAVRAIRPDNGFLSVLAFPFTYNYLFQMGFFNFCYSLAALFIAFGWWWRRQERFGPARTVVFALLVLWVYFCHPVSLVMLLAAVGTITAWRMFLEGFQRRFVGPLLAFVPALALVAYYLSGHAGSRTSMLPVWVKIKHLLALYSLVSLDHRIVALSAALALLFGVVSLVLLVRRVKQGRLAWTDGLLLAVLVFTAAYFLAPNELGSGGFLTHRLNLYPFLGLILWFGTFDYSYRTRGWIHAASVAVAVGFLAMLAPRWTALDDYLTEYMTAAGRIEPGSTLLGLSFSHHGQAPDGGEVAFRVWPFVHASGYIAARKPVVDLALYEAMEDYFPIRYRPGLDPYRRISVGDHLGLEDQPPRVDFLTYPGRTGGRVDYVLLWQLDAAPPDDPRVRSILRQLAAAYEPVYTSPRRLVRLYRSTNGANAVPTAR
jgi:hypothetical protein